VGVMGFSLSGLATSMLESKSSSSSIKWTVVEFPLEMGWGSVGLRWLSVSGTTSFSGEAGLIGAERGLCLGLNMDKRPDADNLCLFGGGGRALSVSVIGGNSDWLSMTFVDGQTSEQGDLYSEIGFGERSQGKATRSEEEQLQK
jgi:hypothetical protein